jgi:Tn3 transposase DDE domain
MAAAALLSRTPGRLLSTIGLRDVQDNVPASSHVERIAELLNYGARLGTLEKFEKGFRGLVGRALFQEHCVLPDRRIADRGAEAQQFRASGLNLVIAAIVFWNSTYIADAVAHLRAIGEAAPDTWLVR